MEFSKPADRARARRGWKRILQNNSDISFYPHSLSMYTDPPTHDISLQQFEDYASERAKVLYFMDSLALSHTKHSEEYNEKLTEHLRKNYNAFLSTTSHQEPSNQEIEWRKRDYISHFILRLAYCRSEDLRHWFLDKELDLFKFRLTRESNASVGAFLRHNKLTYNPITSEEKNKFKTQLKASIASNLSVDNQTFYKVPFTEVLNLVAKRKVFLNEGYAYVPQNDFASILSTRFREALSKALTLTFRNLPLLEEEKDRLIPILKSFSKEAVSTAYDPKKNEGSVNIDDLDELSKKSYPLCMRQLHQHLKSSHHLRYHGRIQYNLFLKGIGVTLEGALKFWKREFTKAMDGDKWEKQYAYNIRHNYGKEGKRTNYTPLNCLAIITRNAPSTGQEHHGCPFKHCSDIELRQRLVSYKTPKESIDEIIDLTRKNHFQIACQKYFAVIHGLEDHTAFQVTHPNSYFDESKRILAGGKPAGPGAREPSRGGEDFVPDWSQASSDMAASVAGSQPQGVQAKKMKISTTNGDDWEDDSALDQLLMETDMEE